MTSTFLREQFDISEFRHCAVLWNQDISQKDIETGQKKFLVARAWLRRQPHDGQPTFFIKCFT